MPKKPPRNAFYFFMVDFKEEQKKKGMNYGNMAQVAEAAGPLWKNAPPEVRSKFEAIAAKEKARLRAPENKYTSTGYSFAEIEQHKQALLQAQENERADIKNMITSNLKYEIPNQYIYVMDVNYYCQAQDLYVIGESSLLRFSIKEGIKECYHEVINPGRIPIGYVSDVKYGSQELGLDMPDENVRRSNYMQILANIIDYLKQQDPSNDVLPPIFTMPDKVAPVVNFINQMCRLAGEDDSLFRVYQLDFLFYTLINAVAHDPDDGFPKESLALAQLKKDPFRYTPGISCSHHEESDKYVECSLSRAKRWAYTILDSCCPVAGVEAVPGRHVPADFDLQSLHVFQEQKKARPPPSLARPLGASDMIRSGSSASTASTVGREIRMRTPKPSFLKTHPTAAPELTFDDQNFPPMGGSRGMGRGRGSGVNSLTSLEKLNLGK